MNCVNCHSLLPSLPLGDAAWCPKCGARQPNEQKLDQFEYSAFISYRHLPRDTEAATKLLHALETYRLPAAVAAHYGAPYLDRMFRDSDEMPATSSLPDTIANALAASRALVVVCTHDTPKSRWIDREIELFAALHGRQNIYLVLAEGSTAESIPDLLKTRLTEQDDGSFVALPAEPFAADMRPGTERRFGLEKLRIVAALADCDYDKLVRRNRTRRRKRIITAAAAALVAALAIGGFSLAQMRTANMAESLRLSQESAQRLASGDRYGALESALEALPPSDFFFDTLVHPLAPEAQQALEDALLINSPNIAARPWLPSYTIETKHNINTPLPGSLTTMSLNKQSIGNGSICVARYADWFATAESDGTVTVYDLRTGALLANCEMPSSAHGEQAFTFLDCSQKHLIALRVEEGNNAVACFEAHTGERLWHIENGPYYEAVFSDDGEVVALYGKTNDTGPVMIAIETKTGATLGLQNWPDLPFGVGAFFCGTFGATAADFFMADSGLLRYYPIDGGEPRTTRLAYSDHTSIANAKNVLVVVSVDTGSLSPDSNPYAIEAFDITSNELLPLWRIDNSTGAQLLGDGALDTMLWGLPEICGLCNDDTAIVVRAGKKLLAYDLQTGNVAWERSYANAVVGAWSESNPEINYCLLHLATSDGYSTIIDLEHQDSSNQDGDFLALQLSENIRWAGYGTLTDPVQNVVVALSAGTPNRVIVYHSNFVEADSSQQAYTLAELRKLAREQLEAAGRN